jgi:phosphoglycerate kinase
MSAEPARALLTLKDLPPRAWRGKRVLLRLDLNVPLDEAGGHYRLARALESLKFLVERGARVLVVSHLGADGKLSLRAVARRLSAELPLGFAPDLGALARVAGKMRPGSAVLLENVRRFPGEKNNQAAFAKQLAVLAEVFVNDAFSVSHRRHASVVGLTNLLPSLAGKVFVEEVTELSRLFNPQPPFMIIIGGAKFATKLPTVKRFLASADEIYLGGALAHPFFKHLGYQTGRSLAERGSAAVLDPLLRSTKFKLPTDVLVVNPQGVTRAVPAAGVAVDEEIIDWGSDSLKDLLDSLARAKTILWNGPIGWVERGFSVGTNSVASAIARSGAYSVIGGGDTLAALPDQRLLKKFSFVSTGGGALLDFLAQGTLPGIEALHASQKKFKLEKK